MNMIFEEDDDDIDDFVADDVEMDDLEVKIEENLPCDFCSESATHTCFNCGKNGCDSHVLLITIMTKNKKSGSERREVHCCVECMTEVDIVDEEDLDDDDWEEIDDDEELDDDEDWDDDDEDYDDEDWDDDDEDYDDEDWDDDDDDDGEFF